MALPGHRHTSSSKRRRGSHFALKRNNLVSCPKCEEIILPHRACPKCGTYKGMEILKLKVEKKKRK
jgi:large subunit ribosomal protein L32